MSNTQLTTQVNTQTKTSALATMAGRLSVDPNKLLDTLKATCFKGASAEEMLVLVAVSNRYGLDPLTKQIYAFPSKGGITPVVSVDGWLHILNSQPQFDGIEFLFEDGPDGKPASVTAVVYRKDRTRPTKVTEYFAECYRPTEPWKQFPRRMLRHKAVKEAVRVAFGISGITDEDEARDIAKNAAAFEKVRVEKVTPKIEVLEVKAEPVVEPVAVPATETKAIEAEVVSNDTAAEEPEWAITLEKRIFEHEPKVNAFLVAKGQISEGQTFRDMTDEGYRNRILSSTPRFLETVLAEVKEVK
jgi:phage recombination protein Bet